MKQVLLSVLSHRPGGSSDCHSEQNISPFGPSHLGLPFCSLAACVWHGWSSGGIYVLIVFLERGWLSVRCFLRMLGSGLIGVLFMVCLLQIFVAGFAFCDLSSGIWHFVICLLQILAGLAFCDLSPSDVCSRVGILCMACLLQICVAGLAFCAWSVSFGCVCMLGILCVVCLLQMSVAARGDNL